jgi:hypothetical protein
LRFSQSLLKCRTFFDHVHILWCLIEKFILSFSTYLLLKKPVLLVCVWRRSDIDLLFFVIYLLLKCLSIFVPLYFLRVRLSICEYCSLFNKPHLFLIMKIWSKWTGQGVLIVKYSLPNHPRIRVNRSLYFSAHFTSVTICLTYCVLWCDRKTVPNIG